MVRARRASASPLMTTTIAARSEVLVLCSFFSMTDRRAALFFQAAWLRMSACQRHVAPEPAACFSHLMFRGCARAVLRAAEAAAAAYSVILHCVCSPAGLAVVAARRAAESTVCVCVCVCAYVRAGWTLARRAAQAVTWIPTAPWTPLAWS